MISRKGSNIDQYKIELNYTLNFILINIERIAFALSGRALQNKANELAIENGCRRIYQIRRVVAIGQ
ncbi:MAG: hypothetical protein QM528_05040 [Phycisphaerales bacterium]|nr:hypothetical protein [Phycisphaerales bacterium]